jgi:hypothetical protein
MVANHLSPEILRDKRDSLKKIEVDCWSREDGRRTISFLDTEERFFIDDVQYAKAIAEKYELHGDYVVSVTINNKLIILEGEKHGEG